jgi:hypothetical protein
MPGLSWANPDQKVFLESRGVGFAKAQNDKTLSQFWVNVCRDFFVHWPSAQSEQVPNGMDPTWDGSHAVPKKKKNKAIQPKDPQTLDMSLEVWVGLRKEVCNKCLFEDYLHLSCC